MRSLTGKPKVLQIVLAIIVGFVCYIVGSAVWYIEVSRSDSMAGLVGLLCLIGGAVGFYQSIPKPV